MPLHQRIFTTMKRVHLDMIGLILDNILLNFNLLLSPLFYLKNLDTLRFLLIHLLIVLLSIFKNEIRVRFLLCKVFIAHRTGQGFQSLHTVLPISHLILLRFHFRCHCDYQLLKVFVSRFVLCLFSCLAVHG